MEEIQLEVGKIYEVRDKKTAKRRGFPVRHLIAFNRSELSACMITDEGYAFRRDGRVSRNSESPFDLVKEIRNQSSPPQ